MLCEHFQDKISWVGQELYIYIKKKDYTAGTTTKNAVTGVHGAFVIIFITLTFL